MNLLAAKLYDPAGAVSKATSALLAMTAFDTTNLRLAVTVPAHGMVRFRLRCMLEGATTFPQILLGVLNGSTVVGRVAPMGAPDGTALATTFCTQDAEFTATGLTPGAANFDAAYGVETVVAATNIKYGGPNNTTANDAFGAFVFEAWNPQPIATTGQLFVDANGRVDVAKWAGTTVNALVSGRMDSSVAAIVAGTYSGVTVGSLATIVAGDYSSSITFGVGGIKAGNYSGVTISGVTTTNNLDKTAYGVTSIAAGTYSGVTVGSLATLVPRDYSSIVTVGVGSILAGNYSGVTISGATATNVLDKTGYGVTSIAAGTYSGVTVGSLATLVSRDYTSLVTVGVGNIAAGNYSGVTISGTTATNNLDKTGYGVTSIAAGTYSGVTVGSLATLVSANYTSKVTVSVGGVGTGILTTANFAVGALDATVFSSDAEAAFADALLMRSIDGGGNSLRSVGQALYVLRNRVDATGSTGTVYQTDDATAAFTFATSVGSWPLSAVDPS